MFSHEMSCKKMWIDLYLLEFQTENAPKMSTIDIQLLFEIVMVKLCHFMSCWFIDESCSMNIEI